jgi:hypothetical protein
MSAQVEEMAAQAQELASTADQLKAMVVRFKLEDNAPSGVAGARNASARPVGPLRRAA